LAESVSSPHLLERSRREGAEFIELYGRRRIGKSELNRTIPPYHHRNTPDRPGRVENISSSENFPEIWRILPGPIPSKEWLFLIGTVFLSTTSSTPLPYRESPSTSFPRLIKRTPPFPPCSRILGYKRPEKYPDISHPLRVEHIDEGIGDDGVRKPSLREEDRAGPCCSPSVSTHVPRLPGGDEEGVEFYAVFGGTPAYLMAADPDRDILENKRGKVDGGFVSLQGMWSSSSGPNSSNRGITSPSSSP
jgi:hypothetical protein